MSCGCDAWGLAGAVRVKCVARGCLRCCSGVSGPGPGVAGPRVGDTAAKCIMFCFFFQRAYGWCTQGTHRRTHQHARASRVTVSKRNGVPHRPELAVGSGFGASCSPEFCCQCTERYGYKQIWPASGAFLPSWEVRSTDRTSPHSTAPFGQSCGVLELHSRSARIGAWGVAALH